MGGDERCVVAYSPPPPGYFEVEGSGGEGRWKGGGDDRFAIARLSPLRDLSFKKTPGWGGGWGGGACTQT